MRRHHYIFMFLLFMATWQVCAMDVTPLSFSSSFQQANEAYARGDYATALQSYQALIADGFVSSELFFNTANAYFRSGFPGQAALFYRRAWLLQPRDPDIHANFNLAQQRTGALAPPNRLIDRIGQEFSFKEWRIATQTAYWIMALAIAVALLVPKCVRIAKPIAIIAGLTMLIGLTGWIYWRQWAKNSEAVVIVAKQTALYEPREKATEFFSVPEGSVVYIEDSFDNWVKIRSGQNAGWLPKSAVERVYSWFSNTIK